MSARVAPEIAASGDCLVGGRRALTMSEFAALSGLSVQSVYNRAAADELPGVVRIGGRLVISVANALALLEGKKPVPDDGDNLVRYDVAAHDGGVE
jgi:hypothetical protein